MHDAAIDLRSKGLRNGLSVSEKNNVPVQRSLEQKVVVGRDQGDVPLIRVEVFQ